MTPLTNNGDTDRVAWRLTMDGLFSNSSTYEFFLDPALKSNSKLFKTIWLWSGPQRWWVHLWKMTMGAIMTNDIRMRRGLIDTALCPPCGLGHETLIHLFKDCETVKDILWAISKGTIPAQFFHEEGIGWLKLNLEDDFLIDGLGWNVWFGLTTLNIWQRRNEKVFQGALMSSTDRCHRVCTQAMWVQSSIDSTSSIDVLSDHQNGRQTKWEALSGWVKLNCDATVTGLGTSAAVGGVLCNVDGNFIMGFVMDIGEATITTAELKAILTGLKLLRGKGYSKIVINSDSLTAVQMVQWGCSNLHPCFQLVKEIQDLMCRINECTISHTLREANQVVDAFAKFGLTLTMCSRIFDCLPPFTSIPFHAGLIGSVFPRAF